MIAPVASCTSSGAGISMKKLLAIVFCLLLMMACSSEPPKSSGQKSESPAAPAGPELVTGRVAFQKLYVAAHGWGPDARPYRLQSQTSKGDNGHEGKSGVWRAQFASAIQRGVKPYVWSGVKADDAPSPGVSPGAEDTYNPSNTNTQVFDIAFLKVDSDKAFTEAQKHGGEKLLQKTPDQPVTYMLDWRPSSNELIWHVYYGNGPEDAKLKVAVDASSGAFLHVEK
jgi:hypothetical protein